MIAMGFEDQRRACRRGRRGGFAPADMMAAVRAELAA
jgi:hypothetical protein